MAVERDDGKRGRFAHPEPELLPGIEAWDPSRELKAAAAEAPEPRQTLGDIGIYTRVTGPATFRPTVLRQRFDRRALEGIDPGTIRVFRYDEKNRTLTPTWNSGVNLQFGFVWSTIRTPAVYVPIGLPRDRVLREVLRMLSLQRRYTDPELSDELGAMTKATLGLVLETPEDELNEMRRILAHTEAQVALPGFADPDLKLGLGGHVAPFALPHGLTLGELRDVLAKLDFRRPLPEESLFFRPELGDRGIPTIPDASWPFPPDPPFPPFPPFPLPDPFPRRFLPWPPFKWPRPLPFPFCWLFSRNWWMYHHDERHSGVASGCTGILSTTVSGLTLRPPTATLDGTVVSIPSIVDGKIYVGTANVPGTGPGGKLYKIDLLSGAIELHFDVPRRYPAYFQGVGGSPAVVGGRVYFSSVPGMVFCLDAATFTELWRVDLRDPDSAHNQPVKNNIGSSYNADSWPSPLVVNGRVYVGCGEGEDALTYGFVYCLDAATGNVIWLFCTNKLDGGGNTAPHNAPNVIPPAVAVSSPLPAWASGFTIHPNPVPETGCSVWSSCAYDVTLDRIYVGTGNSKYDSTQPGMGSDLPDEMYGSGLLSLNATTGAFAGFFQPGADDSYRPTDGDVDVPGSPTVFSRGGTRVVAFGSKNGSFFLLDAATMQVLGGGAQRRQLLPRSAGSGTPADRGATIATVANSSAPYHENEWGVYATPAIHYGLGKLYIGLGGRGAITDPSKTPFVRALDWNTLADAWPGAVDPADNVFKYTTARPPVYGSSEVGLGSPAIVNDVVFMSTNKTALYALRASDGLCLWSAPGLPSFAFALGAAVYGNYVVVGAGSGIYRYAL